ncbi:MAG: creatininase [Azospirillum brasilense]|nr:MAG: creatininase [Azospirillum brasilense]
MRRSLALLLGFALMGGHVAWAATPSVFLEALTWQELRDAQRAGTTRVIIPTGGTEQNGPHMVLGKHNVIVQHTAAMLAEALGHTLVAPVMAYVPEGSITPPQGHMRFPGTISLREEIFEAVLEDTARSLKQGGFTAIYFLGDSGGNQQAQARVAAKLAREWKGEVRIATLSDYYGTPAPHGSEADTARLLAVQPAAVRTQKITPHTEADYASSGAEGDARGATPAMGKAILARQVKAALAQIRALEK